jgi:hypothetical protein
MRQSYDIQRVRDIRPCAGGHQITFPSGVSSCLLKGHPDQERILQQAHSSVQAGSPVGFVVNQAGELLELNYTYQSAVRHVEPDDEDPSRVVVEFWSYSPICYLTRDHPDFERILRTLKCAVKEEKPVILANHIHMIDGETETWWKLLDVRPAVETMGETEDPATCDGQTPSSKESR